eukprot:363565-Chlamydomonas_euryale.AAC.4
MAVGVAAGGVDVAAHILHRHCPVVQDGVLVDGAALTDRCCALVACRGAAATTVWEPEGGEGMGAVPTGVAPLSPAEGRRRRQCGSLREGRVWERCRPVLRPCRLQRGGDDDSVGA